MKRFFYYAIVILTGAFILFNIYNSKSLFNVKADIESYTYQIEKTIESLTK